MRIRSMLGLLAAAVAVGGCASTGLKERQGLSQAFDVSADYQAAYRRAGEYVRICHEERAHPYGATYASRRELGVRDAPHQIQIYKTTEPAKVLAIIQSAANTPSSSRVTVTVLGEGKWDQAEIDAARQSIQSATPVCRAER
ncbi:BPTD_2524 family lipoprotein [Bordetella sp. 2513F-2]